MNYLERLIRRALLDAPARAGDALRDPFENEAPMPFDSPTQSPATPWPQRGPAQTPAAFAPLPVPDAVVARDASPAPRETGAEIAPTATPLSPPEVVASPSLRVEPPPAPVAPAPVPAALAQADAFMRTIGAAMPEPLPASTARIVPDAPAALPMPASHANDEIGAVVEAAPVPARNPTAIQPPPPRLPTPQASPRAAVEAPPPRAPAQTRDTPPPRERASAPRAVTEVVRETIHVVRIADPDTARSAQQGASPSAFGAGQL
jgi:hypothetical protein